MIRDTEIVVLCDVCKSEVVHVHNEYDGQEVAAIDVEINIERHGWVVTTTRDHVCPACAQKEGIK